MLKYAIKKIFASIVILIFAIFIVFMIVHELPPIDPITFALGSDALADTIHHWSCYMFITPDPLLVRYFNYIVGIVFWGDFGHSFTRNQSANSMLAQYLPYTLKLTAISLTTALTLAIPIGAISAARKNTRTDKFIRSIAYIGASTPVFALGMLLVAILLPLEVSSLTYSLLLPSFSLGFGTFCIILLSVRANCIKVLEQNYITTAHAKGLTKNRIIFKHVLRNVLSPTLSVFRDNLGAFLGGVVIIEFFFGRAGIGRLLMQSVLRSDYPVILACVIVFIFGYVAIDFLVDIAQWVLNPRVKKMTSATQYAF